MTISYQKQKRALAIFGVLAIFLLAIIAIVTAIRLQQAGTEPVAPSVPKSKPRAAEIIPTPGPDSACRKTWIIAAAPTPTGTPIPTLTPTGTLTPPPISTPTPTGTPIPTGTLTPTPTPTSTPTPTGTLTPTPTPTEPPQPTNTPVPGAPDQPTNTPVPLAQGPTAIPTVPQQSLPDAGGALPTIVAAVSGLGILLLGLLLLL